MITIKRNAIGVVLWCSLFLTGCFSEPVSPPQPTDETVTISSAVLQNSLLPIVAQRELIISLPPSYHTDVTKNYPVVYLLHGFGANAYGWFSNIGGEPNIRNALAKLYSEQQINEMIVVVPDSYNKHSAGGWYSNSAAGGNWEDYIIKEVIPYVDNNYRTSKTQRGVAGSSMGGYGALKFAIKYPALFSAVYAMSPALVGEHWLSLIQADQFTQINAGLAKAKPQWTDEDLLNYSVALSFAPNNTPPLYAQVPFTDATVKLIELHSITRLLDENLAQFKAHLPAIKLDVGNQDQLIGNDLREFAQQLDQADINAFYSVYPGGHSDRLNLLVEEEVFQFFSMSFSDTLPEKLPGSLAVLADQLAPKPQIIQLDAFVITGLEASDYEGSARFAALWNKLREAKLDINLCKTSSSIGFNTINLADYNFSKPNRLDYLVGCELNEGASFPDELQDDVVKRDVPKNTYAVFTFQGVMDQRYADFFMAILRDWLPTSGYTPADGYLFEYYGADFVPNSDASVMHLYIPIKKP